MAILQGAGNAFTSSIDQRMMMGMGDQIQNDCVARTRENLREVILDLQETLTSLEHCRKPEFKLKQMPKAFILAGDSLSIK